MHAKTNKQLCDATALEAQPLGRSPTEAGRARRGYRWSELFVCGSQDARNTGTPPLPCLSHPSHPHRHLHFPILEPVGCLVLDCGGAPVKVFT